MTVDLKKLEELYNNTPTVQPSVTVKTEPAKQTTGVDMDKLAQLYNAAPEPIKQDRSKVAPVLPVKDNGKSAVQQQNYDRMQRLFNRTRESDAADLARVNNEILAISGYGAGADRSKLQSLFQQKDQLEQRLKTGRYDEDLTALERVQLTAQGIGESLNYTPDVLIDTATQAYRDRQANKENADYLQLREQQKNTDAQIALLERRAMQGVLDDAGFAQLAQLRNLKKQQESDAQQYRTPLNINSDSAQGMRRAMQAQQQATYGMSDTAAFLYNTGASIAENASLMPLAMLPGGQTAILAIMGAKSAAQKAVEVGESGGTAAEALVRGLSSGLIESATEKLPLDNLVKIAKGSTGKAIIKNILKQSGEEGTEEAVSYIANSLVDMAAMDPNAKFSIAELLMAFGGGALSGGVMGVGGYGVGRAVDNVKNKKAEKTKTAENNNILSNNVEEITGNRDNLSNNVENSAENAINDANIDSTVVKTEERKALENEVKKAAGIDTRTETEKVIDRELSRVTEAENVAAIIGASAEEVEKVRQSAAENIAEARAKESLDSAVKLIEHVGKEADIYSDSRDRAAAYNTAKRIGINLAHGDTTAMGRAVHEVGHDKTQSEQWQNYTAALDRLIATDGRLVKLMDDIDYAYRNSEDSEIRASVSFEDGTIDNAKVRNEQYLKLTEIMLPNIAKGDKQLLDAIKKDRNVLDNLLDFIRGIKNKVSIKLTKSEAAMLDEAERQLVNLLRSEGAQAEGKQYSYGGTNAAVAPEGVARAREMADTNADNETIRKETGWFRGADGKWRFEIDDSKATVSYKGENELNKNPEYKEYQELFNKIYIQMEGSSSEENNRLKELSNKFANVKKDLRLKDYLQHDELYRQYPQLAVMPVIKVEGKPSGKYDGVGIQINEKLFKPGNEKQLKETLLHEIQHAIQDMEEFASGSSTKFWTGREGDSGKTAKELYLNTAGEQESRDVTKRMNYTAEQRQAEAPFTGDENTVFAEDAKYAEDVAILDNGNVYVIASRNVITGTTRDAQRNDITNFFNKLLKKNKSLDIQTIDGDVLTITKSETADKARDDYKTINGNRVKLTDKEFKVKLNAEAHIDELAETSKEIKNSWTPDTKNHAFAKDGFTYRRAYFEDFDGQYYEITLSIGNADSIATVYNVGKTKNKSVPSSAKLIAVVRSQPLDETLSINNVSQTAQNSNGNNLSENDNTDYSLQSDIDANEYWGENSKSRAVERHAVNEFASAVADLMGVEYKDKNEVLKKQAWKLADAAKKTGMFNSQQMIDFFNDAYNLGKQETGNLDQRNKQLKKELHNLGIKPLKGREYLDFVQKYKGKIMFNRNGLDIDIAYKQLAENYPEWFSEDITNPYDMMRTIGDVYDSIQGKKVSNNEYFGKDAEAFKNAAFQQYSALVDNFIDTMNSVSRYQLALSDQKAQEKTASKKVYTLEDVKAARELAQPLMKEIARMDRKNLFTAEDRNRLNEMLKLTHPADIERMQESLRATNPLAEDIIAMYEKKKMLEAVKKPIYEYNKQRKARLKSQFLDILQTSDSWKDKGSGLAYMNNTFERNIDDIVTDKKAAEKLKDVLPRQIHKHVADATRYKNKLRDKIRGFNIDTKKVYNIEVTAAGELLKGEATEADLIQMYGEGIVTKQYLDKIGANTKKIVETADKFREIYNELFEKINEAYVANGYAPMEYRQDYFPHFFDETGDTLLNKVGQFLGFDARNMLPTEIAGRTHEFSPGRQWNSHALQRKGEKTDYNVLKGFDNYIEAAANIIHLTEDIQNLRAFENAIRYKYSDEGMKAELDAIDALAISETEKEKMRKDIFAEDRNTKLNNLVVWEHEYTNLLAGKKSKADRWIEDMFGRRFYTVAKNIENRVSANMIAGNISSALTNFIPITQLTAEVDGRYILTAMSDTIKNMKNNDNFVDMSDFLTNRFGSEMLSLTNMQKAANIAGKPMELVDEFTSNVVTRARYLQNVNKGGMDSVSAMKDADEYAASLMADRSKGALPTIFESKNPIIKLFTMFQVEQANQLNYLFKDLPRKKQEKAKGWLLWAFIKLGVFSFLYNWMFEQLSGRKPAFSPVDMIYDTGKDITEVAKGEKKASAALSDSFVRTMETLPYASSVLAMTGLSEDAGRIPVSGALPDFSQLAYLMDRDVSAEKKNAVAMKEFAKPIANLVLPAAGGQAKKIFDAGVLYGKNKGVQYSIQSDGSKKVQFANDPSAAAFLQAAAFGKWASKPAQEYIDSGFKGLSKNQTKAFEGLKNTGLKNSEATAMVKSIKEADTNKNSRYTVAEAKEWLNSKNYTREQKAILFSCMCPNVKNNPYK